MKRYICTHTDTSKRLWYVSQLRGRVGDWGYEQDRAKAVLMSERTAKIYCNEGPGRRQMHEVRS